MNETEDLLHSPANKNRPEDSIAQLEEGQVTILFFGSMADKTGQKYMKIKAGLSLNEVIQQVACADIQSLLVAVNQEQINDMSLLVKDGDEVAIMPPFSGG